MFDVYYIGKNDSLKTELPLAKSISSIKEINPRTKMYWLVEEHVEVTEPSVFEYRPQEYDAQYEHVWKWRETDYGGVKLIPSKGKPDGVKEIDQVVCKRKFDIFYLGENPDLQSEFPLATQIETTQDIKSNTNMYWLIEPNISITDWEIFDFRPEPWDQIYAHLFKWNSTNYGGVHLLPVDHSTDDVKHINKVVCKKRFDIIRRKEPRDYFDKNPTASHVWCVDPDYRVDELQIDWAPGNFEPDYIHSFHLRGQLEHKYPREEGGVKLYPRDFKDATIKFHRFLDAAAKYPVVRCRDVYDNSLRDKFEDEYVWLIDKDYEINEETLDWSPNPFESDFIHQFKMPYQLNEKYPSNEGGIRLVPKDYEDAISRIHNGTIVHLDCPITDVEYDVFYINEELDEEVIKDYADRSKTDWFWLVDKDYDINGALRYVPQRGEQEYCHVFNVPGQVEDKYPIADWNSSYEHDPMEVGGVWLIPKGYDLNQWKYQTDIVPVRYDIFYTDDINTDPGIFARKSTTNQFWLVESEHRITDDLNWVPTLEFQRAINEFTFGSDTAPFPVKLIPKKYEYAQTIQQERLRNVFDQTYEVYTSEKEGREKTNLEWFWVVDTDVDIVDDFDWDFTPDKWDGSYLNEGKTHMWQKLNPITGRQYDYGGVMLCPKKPQSKGRPKYIMEPGCVQKEYPVYHLTGKEDAMAELESFDVQTKTKMYWVVDAFTKLSEDFDFSYYPTQWDISKIHVFTDEDGVYRNVRLYPKGTFKPGHSYDLADVAYNRFTPVQDVKRMNTVASLRPSWPVLDFIDFTVDELSTSLAQYNKKGIPFMWTVDPDVEVNRKMLYEKFSPGTVDETGSVNIPDFDKPAEDCVHSWQRMSKQGEVLNNSGLRLWPTNYDVTHLTDKKLRLNDIAENIYVDSPGCTQPDYKIFYLNADNDQIKQLEEFEKRVSGAMYYVVDPFTKVLGEWEWDFYPSKYEEEYVHVFKTMEGEHRNIRLYPKGTFSGDHGYTVEKIHNNSFTELKKLDIEASSLPTFPVIDLADITKDQFLEQMKEMALVHGFVWSKDGDVDAHQDVINSGFLPAMDKIHKVHVWQRMNPHTNNTHSYGGLRLWPTVNDYSDLTSEALFLNKIKNIQYVRKPGCTYKPYEIVFLSYHEPYAENAYKRLQARFNVTWIKDIEGIFTAHQQAANTVTSSMFWVVDADAEVADDFDFSYMPDVYDQDVVHVWNSVNPITGQEYGYGGVKLFNTQQVREATSWGLDFTTGLSSRFKAMPQISNITRFNTDEFSTWRSAFRECVKLTANADEESRTRLSGWLNPVTDARYRDQALAGAKDGISYAKEFANKPLKMAKINDYEWLEDYYNEQYKS